MSSTERKKGKLVPVDWDVLRKKYPKYESEITSFAEILSYTNEEFIAIPNNSGGTKWYKLYQVKMEIEESDEYYFIDTKVSRNGTISFHTMYDNGGTYWAELVEGGFEVSIELKKPQLAASEIPDIYTEVTWPKIIQPKLDGICCLAVNGVAMSRTMKPIPNKFIQKFFEEKQLHGLHGELMIAGDFNDVQSGVMRVEGEPDFYYVVYDIWNTTDCYDIRFETLSTFLPEDYGRVKLIQQKEVNNSEECITALEGYIAEGYEGAILRDPYSGYKQGRHTLKSQALMKLKKFYDDEAKVVGFEEKMHNSNEQEKDERGYSKRSSKKEGMVPADTLGALIVKWGDVEFKIGSGYTEAQRQDIWENRDKLLGKLVTFRYQELSKYQVPRFPTWKCFREEYNEN